MSKPKKQRDYFEILKDILVACSYEPLTNHKIARKARLHSSFTIITTRGLLECGLISVQKEETKSFFKITEKGSEFVKAFRNLMNIMGSV